MSPYSGASAFTNHQTQKLHQRKGTNDQPFGFDVSNDFIQTPPSTSLSLSSTLHSLGDMEGLLEGGDSSPSENDLDRGNRSLVTTGMQTPVDFGIPFEPSFLSSNEYTSRGLGSSAPARVAQTGSPSHQSTSCPGPLIQETSSDTWLCQTSVLGHHAVVAAREGWSYFKCNSTSARSACPKTARIYVEGLEQTLKSRDAWQQRDLLPEIVKPAANRCSIMIEPFSSFTRDKLLAITQSFLHKASKIHGANSPSGGNAPYMESTGFIILPPPNLLEHFLEAYVFHIEPYYPSVPAGLLNANDLMRVGNAQAASLLLLLMIALGASATSIVEARFLTSGLTEACRISLFHIVEKEIELAEDLNVLRCGLLLMTAAVWSGDKWHMDVSCFFSMETLV